MAWIPRADDLGYDPDVPANWSPDVPSTVQEALDILAGFAGGGIVASVNGQTGSVSLDSDDIPEGAVNKFLTATQETALTGGGNADAQHVHALPSLTGSINDTQHGNRGGGSLHADATAIVAGFMSAADKSKLDGIAPGAQVNTVASVNTKTGAVVLNPDDLDDTSSAHKFASASQLSDIAANTAARHTHANKALLDTYTQSEANLADAVAKKHSHTNLALLETYTQSEANLADAVSKKHTQGTDLGLDTGGANAITAATIKSHVESTSNPHSTTKAQVGLGNVTDDAQLKRAAGDIGTFTDKAGATSGDFFLIEDGADSGNKKRLNASRVARNPASPIANDKLVAADGSGGLKDAGVTAVGIFKARAESAGETSFTGDTAYQTKVSVAPSLAAGTYEIMGTLLQSGNDAPSMYGVRLLIDGVTVKGEAPFTVADTKKYADGLWCDRTIRTFVTLGAGSHTFELQFNVNNATKIVYVKEAAITVRGE